MSSNQHVLQKKKKALEMRDKQNNQFGWEKKILKSNGSRYGVTSDDR